MSVIRSIAAGLVAIAILLAVPAAGAPVALGHVGLSLADTDATHGGGSSGGGWHPGGWTDERQPVLEPGEIRRILRDRGFRDIRALDRRGAIYQVHAVDDRQGHVGLVVSARSGAVLAQYPIH